MIEKCFGCTTINNKALYKCIIHSFIVYRKSEYKGCNESLQISVSRLKFSMLHRDIYIDASLWTVSMGRDM